MLNALRCTLSTLIILGVIVAIAAVIPGWLLSRRYEPSILELDAAPMRSVGIVFGAGIRSDGRPMRVLEDRVRTAAELFHAGKIERLLLSGATRRNGHHETDSMLDLAMQLGVPRDRIWLDYEGTRTFETCARASEHWSVKDAVLVTQRFHLPRAMLICDSLGMDAVGVSADRRVYSSSSMTFWQLREIPATLRALWDLGFHTPSDSAPSPPPVQEMNNHGS
jgi:vancomycin permeability regulator SanA